MKRRLPPLNALRAFEAAARLGRMTAAADELAVTPGAISRQVRQLELALGVPLFEGSKSKPRLTAQAQMLLPTLSSAFDQIEHAVRTASQHDKAMLDISCFSTFTAKWLIPRLQARSGQVFEHYYFTLEAAIGGMGICIAPWHLVIDDIRAGRLVAPLGFQESGYQYVAKRSAQPNKNLDKFCDWLQAQARETAVP